MYQGRGDVPRFFYCDDVFSCCNAANDKYARFLNLSCSLNAVCCLNNLNCPALFVYNDLGYKLRNLFERGSR